jgi:hypothetical protein
VYDFDGFEADGDYLSHKAHYVLRVVGAVRVVGDAASLVCSHLILVYHPVEEVYDEADGKTVPPVDGRGLNNTGADRGC